MLGVDLARVAGAAAVGALVGISAVTSALPAGAAPPGAIGYQTMPPCTSGLIAPSDVRLTSPTAETAADLAVLVGAWEGTLSQPVWGPGEHTDVPAMLVVEEVAANRARVIFATAPGSWTRGGWNRGWANVGGGGMVDLGGGLRVSLDRAGQSLAGRWEGRNSAEGSSRDAPQNVTVIVSLGRCGLL